MACIDLTARELASYFGVGSDVSGVRATDRFVREGGLFIYLRNLQLDAFPPRRQLKLAS